MGFSNETRFNSQRGDVANQSRVPLLLTHFEYIQGTFAANYEINQKETPQHGSYLDPSHTHFLLVDNGTFRKFGTEIVFRSEVEEMLGKLSVSSSDSMLLFKV